MPGSHSGSCLSVGSSGVLGRAVRPPAVMTAIGATACGGDGGTGPEPVPEPNRPLVARGSVPAQSLTAGLSVQVDQVPLRPAGLIGAAAFEIVFAG